MFFAVAAVLLAATTPLGVAFVALFLAACVGLNLDPGTLSLGASTGLLLTLTMFPLTCWMAAAILDSALTQDLQPNSFRLVCAVLGGAVFINLIGGDPAVAALLVPSSGTSSSILLGVAALLTKGIAAATFGASVVLSAVLAIELPVGWLFSRASIGAPAIDARIFRVVLTAFLLSISAELILRFLWSSVWLSTGVAP